MSNRAELVVVVLAAALTVALSQWFPARLPLHFDATGRPDIWAPAPLALAPGPLTALLFITLGKQWSAHARGRRGIVLWSLLLAHAAVCSYGLGLG